MLDHILLWIALLLAPLSPRLPHGAGVLGGDGCTCGPAEYAAFPGAWVMDYSYKHAPPPGHLYVRQTYKNDSPLMMGQIAARYPGSVWVLGNEPNDPNQDHQPPDEYAATARAQAWAIHAADPTAVLVSAGLAEGSTWWAQAIVDRLGADFFDAWDIHSYNLEGDPYDASTVQARVLRFRAWMQATGQGAKPLIVGEYGLPPGATDLVQGLGYQRTTTQWLQECGCVTAWAWFNLRAAPHWPAGLLTTQGYLTPYGLAYGKAARIGGHSAHRPR
jgi:hypothetical protein